MMILSEAEIDAMCKPIRQRAAQARHLSALLGCQIKRRPDGLPIILREMYESWLNPPPPAVHIHTPMAKPRKTYRTWSETPLGRWQKAQREGDPNLRCDPPVFPPPLTRLEQHHLDIANAERMAEHKASVVRFHVAKRRCSKLQRTPAWADMDAMRAIYAEARRLSRTTGIPHHVDHAIPLQGRSVSGLHVHNNLQILTGSENSKKRNRFEIEQ